MEFLASGANLLLIIAGFGLLIVVHEFGHFIAAKWAGIRTESFSIGFGPPICSWRRGVGFCWGSTDTLVQKRAGRISRLMTDAELDTEGIGETEYSLRWLPLGGFVRMLGQDDLDPSRGAVTSSRSFNQVTIARRMVVVSAGVIMNVLLAAVCFIIALGMGVRFEAPVVGMVGQDQPASRAVQVGGPGAHDGQVGLQPGDVVVAIDAKPAVTFSDIQIASAMSVPGDVLRFTIRRPGIDELLRFDVEPELNEAMGMIGIGIAPASSTTLAGNKRSTPLVESMLRSADLADEGIGPGWTLDSVAGTEVSTWDALNRWFRDGDGSAVSTAWSGPDGARTTAQLEPRPTWEHLRYPDATGETLVGYELGLGGLVPLVRIVGVSPGSANEDVFRLGDAILEFNGIQAPRGRVFLEAIRQAGGGSVPVTVLRDGQRTELEAQIVMDGVLEPVPKLQVSTGYAWAIPRTAAPMRESGVPARTTMAGEAAGGILPGSRLVSLDDAPIANWKDLWVALRTAARAGQESVNLVVENPTPMREHRSLELPMDVLARGELADLMWQPPIRDYWFDPIYITRSSGGNPVTAISMGAQETWKFIVLTYITVDRLFRGTVGVEQLHGPVGIVHLGTRLSDRGWAFLLFFLAIISVNLAVLNFLPLPIVDGGLFLYLVYEKIRGRPPSVGFQNASMLVGLVLIAALFIVTFYNDLVRLIG